MECVCFNNPLKGVIITNKILPVLER